MSRRGMPYAGVLLTLWASWACGQLTMIARWAMWRAGQRGLIDRPAFRLPGAPYTNYVTVLFLVFVLAMTWENGMTGQWITGYGLPVTIILLFGGWFLARGKVARIRGHTVARRHNR
jgi:L-asparagine permease